MAVSELEAKATGGGAASQVALAARLDSGGRHTEAIEWLARAAKAGDQEALCQLGLRLVTGRDAPFLPGDGARLLSDAAVHGSAEAAERLAVLIGGGFHVRQNWDAALQLLARAAELDSASAQAQLRILSGEADAAGDWTGLKDRIDLKPWTTAPAVRTLNESPSVRAVEGLVPQPACAWVMAEAAGRLERAELYDPATGLHGPGEETRLNRIANFGLAETSLLNLLIQSRISAAAGIPFAMMEAFAVLHYAPGEEYGDHVDFLDPEIPAYAEEIRVQGQRVATCLVYLNDGYEGGETEFPALGISFKGRAGDALIFSSVLADGAPDPRTVHAGRPPTSGEKWLLSQFFRNRPIAPGAALR